MKRLRAANMKLWQKRFTMSRWSVPLLVVISVFVILGLAVPLIVLILLNQPDILERLGLDGVEGADGEREVEGITRWQKVLIAGGVVTLSAAIAGLVISYRKQLDAEDTKMKTEFANAAAQLGSASASVRIAGVYAMAAIADGDRRLRQQCIDVLCGHLRLPYTPDVGSNHDLTRTVTHHMSSSTHTETYTSHHVPGEREVRFTIIRAIRDHLQLDTDNSWHNCVFDFTGAVFDGGDFSGAQFTHGNILFKQSQFVGGITSFTDANFAGGHVSFDDAKFSGGHVSFDDAKFSGGHVSFKDATFCGGDVSFLGAQFSGGHSSFRDAKFSGGHVSFDGAKFSGGFVSFLAAKFSYAQVSFVMAQFSGSLINFSSATFSGGFVNFVNASFSDGRVSFLGVQFSGGKVNFYAKFLPGGHVDLGLAHFTGTDVRLERARFSGGVFKFKKVKEWKVPPILPDPIPEGLHLPVHLNDQG